MCKKIFESGHLSFSQSKRILVTFQSDFELQIFTESNVRIWTFLSRYHLDISASQFLSACLLWPCLLYETTHINTCLIRSLIYKNAYTHEIICANVYKYWHSSFICNLCCLARDVFEILAGMQLRVANVALFQYCAVLFFSGWKIESMFSSLVICVREMFSDFFCFGNNLYFIFGVFLVINKVVRIHGIWFYYRAWNYHWNGM